MNVSVPSVCEDTTIMISVATSLLPYEGIAILTPLEAKNSVWSQDVLYREMKIISLAREAFF